LEHPANDSNAARDHSVPFEANDVIGICAYVPGPDNLPPVVVNVPYTYTDGAFAAGTEAIYYPADGSDISFLAYYPWVDGLTKEDPTISIDVADQTSPKAIDLLYAKTKDEEGDVKYNKNSGIPVALTFYHQLSKVLFNITTGDNLVASDLDGMTVSVKGFYTTGTYDLSSEVSDIYCTVTKSGTPGTFRPAQGAGYGSGI
jgi:hypothetical protein